MPKKKAVAASHKTHIKVKEIMERTEVTEPDVHHE
jgi:hypothetical protein